MKKQLKALKSVPKQVIRVAMLVLLLSTLALAGPNGGKNPGNPRHLPRMGFSIPLPIITSFGVHWFWV